MGFKLGSALAGLTKSVTKTASGGLFSIDPKKPSKGGSASMGVSTVSTAVPTFKATQGPAQCGIVFDRGKFTRMHVNKSTYVTRGGGTSRWSKGFKLHERGTECVPPRKLNAGNGRAAIRAVRRLVAFYRLSQRVAKQLRRAASAAHIRGGRRGQRQLPRGGGGVEVVNVD